MSYVEGRIDVLTVRGLVEGVASAWRSQYGDKPVGERLAGVQERLDALDATATAEQVNEIIGNDSWTSLDCDVCRETVDALVRLGDEPDYDSTTLNVCVQCLQRASTALRACGVTYQEAT